MGLDYARNADSLLAKARSPQLLAIIAGLGFLLLGLVWSVASPPRSSADDNTHLSSIWCAWGASDSCRLGTPAAPDFPAPYLLPTSVGTEPCFARAQNTSAGCLQDEPDDWVSISSINLSTYNPPVYSKVMRIMVGPDIAASVIHMRWFNVLLAAALLLLAYLVALPGVRLALTVGWAIALLPIALFTIASTNPSSWLIIGAGTYWVFLLALLDRAASTWQFRLALLGLAASVVLLLGARVEGPYALILSSVCVLILRWRKVLEVVRRRPLLFLLAAALAGLAIFLALTSRLGRLLQDNTGRFAFPPGDSARDQPGALLKALVELPHFLTSTFGAQWPSWSQRQTWLDTTSAGWTWTGFQYGAGWLDLQMPASVSVLLVGGVCAMLVIGLRDHGWPKAIACALAFLGLCAQILVQRAIWGFHEENGIQPRYLVPLVLLACCLLVIQERRRPFLNLGQALVLATAFSLAAAMALRATIARYAYGQEHSWTGFDQPPYWWWGQGPSPSTVWILGALAGCAMFVAVFIRASIRQPMGPRIPLVAATASVEGR